MGAADIPIAAIVGHNDAEFFESLKDNLYVLRESRYVFGSFQSKALAHDTRWDDDMLVNGFSQLAGSDFEAVDVSSLIVNPDSGQAHATSPFVPSHFQYLPIARR